jgi:hypothetical protein
MPKASEIQAATPKCSSQRTVGPESQRCDTPMIWNARRGVWVCPCHPHMQVTPEDFEAALLAPAAERNPIIYGEREIWQ